jgi:GDPmannose 4,6-dehydratase
MGNIDSLRDWGHAKDYVEMQWLMLQQEVADDFVIATGRQISVRRFIELSCQHAGLAIVWSGTGVQEVGTDAATGKVIVRIDPRYFRPTEVDTLLGDPAKAREKLGWVPKTTVEELCQEMMAHDLEEARQETIARAHGLTIKDRKE